MYSRGGIEAWMHRCIETATVGTTKAWRHGNDEQQTGIRNYSF